MLSIRQLFPQPEELGLFSVVARSALPKVHSETKAGWYTNQQHLKKGTVNRTTYLYRCELTFLPSAFSIYFH
jgi:hypothetical protein